MRTRQTDIDLLRGIATQTSASRLRTAILLALADLGQFAEMEAELAEARKSKAAARRVAAKPPKPFPHPRMPLCKGVRRIGGRSLATEPCRKRARYGDYCFHHRHLNTTGDQEQPHE